MKNRKLTAPMFSMDEEQYKLSYFSESLSEFELNLSEVLKKSKNHYKKLKQWFKKDILHIEMFKPVCPECYTKNVIKNNIKTRILYFYDKGKVNSEIQGYKCKKCGEIFYTDINEMVCENS
ncbi:MAG: hypothetical protein LBM26_05205, partial [Methanobrevibacter sp.]|nr:hypothetical protein [Methanobrevibacter sp.]